MSRSLSRISLRHAPAIAIAIAIAAGGAIFWHGRAVAKAQLNESGPVAVDAAPSSSADEQSGSSILLGLDRDAIRDGRLVAPAGNNAYELYLSVLQLQPDN